MAKAAGFDAWHQFFQQKNRWPYSAPERPEMRAWKSVTDLSDPYQIAERNPYYWKVDTAGNQLPYIDRVMRELVSAVDIMILKVLSGDIDFQGRHLWTQYSSYTVFVQNREKGGYRVLKYRGGDPSRVVIYLNQTVKDPVLRELFRNKKFRIALSLGIDRNEINELVFMGLGEPSQGHSTPGHPAYVESIAKAYTEYDPKKANDLLDEIGLTKRDSEGIRLRPDGKPLNIILDVSSHHPDHVDAAELIVDHWKDIGIKAVVKAEDRTLFNTRGDANEAEIRVWSFSDAVEPLVDQYHAPNTYLAPLWYNWLNTGGKSGEEPPSEVKRLWEIFTDKALATTSEVERTELLKEAMKIWSDNLWAIGTVGIPWYMFFAKNDLRNVPEDAFLWHPGAPGAYDPCTFFFKK
ncbi:MAG: ABC transporter substrate-binding protein [bacterium]